MRRRKPTDSLGEFEHCVLLAVAHLGVAAYGVTIRQEIEQRTDRAIAIGALYTSLARLEVKGYLRSVMSDPPPARGGRSKRFFATTPAGRAALCPSPHRRTRSGSGLQPAARV